MKDLVGLIGAGLVGVGVGSVGGIAGQDIVPFNVLDGEMVSVVDEKEVGSDFKEDGRKLPYSEEEMGTFFDEVKSWEFEGTKVYEHIRNRMANAGDKYIKGKMSLGDYVLNERKAIVGLTEIIKMNVGFERDKFELSDFVSGSANCFGYVQALCFAGKEVGLDVSGIHTRDGHVANMIEYEDKKIAIIDLIRSDGFVSPPERVDKVGGEWKTLWDGRITNGKVAYKIMSDNDLTGEVFFCRGTVNYMGGRAEEAVGLFDTALEYSYNNPVIHNNRGGALLMLGEHKRAIDDFKMAIKFRENYISAYHNLGNAHLDSEDFPRAIKSYDEALKRDSTFVKAYFGRAFAHLSTGNNRKAVEDTSRAIELNPGYARAYYLRAIGNGEMGLKLECARDLRMAKFKNSNLAGDVEKVCREYEISLDEN